MTNLGVVLSIFMIISSALCAPEVSPAISFISKTKLKSIGDEVEFNCSVTNNDDDATILWIKLDKERTDRVPISTNDRMLVRDKRFSITVDNKTSTYSLKIKELQEADSGYYVCQILINVNNHVSQEVELQIKRAPSIIRSNTTLRSEQIEYGSVELKCNADGYPLPTISWKRENNALLPNGTTHYVGNILKISKIHRQDRGTYYCFAGNGVAPEARANITVKVAFKPDVIAVRPKVGQALGYSSTLECIIESFPKPEFSWWKNGVKLTEAYLKEVGDNDEYLTSARIRNVDSQDYGEYVCKASNQHGETEAKVELFETIVPVCSGSCR